MYRLEAGHIERCAEWEEIRDARAAPGVRLVREIRGGRFPACCEDERCTGYCPYASICRVNQARAMEKT